MKKLIGENSILIATWTLTESNAIILSLDPDPSLLPISGTYNFVNMMDGSSAMLRFSNQGPGSYDVILSTTESDDTMTIVNQTVTPELTQTRITILPANNDLQIREDGGNTSLLLDGRDILDLDNVEQVDTESIMYVDDVISYTINGDMLSQNISTLLYYDGFRFYPFERNVTDPLSLSNPGTLYYNPLSGRAVYSVDISFNTLLDQVINSLTTTDSNGLSTTSTETTAETTAATTTGAEATAGAEATTGAATTAGTEATTDAETTTTTSAISITPTTLKPSTISTDVPDICDIDDSTSRRKTGRSKKTRKTGQSKKTRKTKTSTSEKTGPSKKTKKTGPSRKTKKTRSSASDSTGPSRKTKKTRSSASDSTGPSRKTKKTRSSASDSTGPSRKTKKTRSSASDSTGPSRKTRSSSLKSKGKSHSKSNDNSDSSNQKSHDHSYSSKASTKTGDSSRSRSKTSVMKTKKYY